MKWKKTVLRRNTMLVLEGAFVGTLAGLTAIAYRYCLSYAETGLYWTLNFIRGNALYIACWFAFLVLAAIVVARIIRWEPMASGSGIPQICGEKKGHFNTSWWRVILAKFLGGTLSIFGGLSLGREGPSIQLGAMAAKGYSRMRGYGRSKELSLLACGAGAGLAAAFNAPLAGVLFVLEEIRHSFGRMIIVGGLIATLCADYISKIFFSQSAIFCFDSATFALRNYWLLIILGILLGFAGAGYNYVMLKTQALFHHFKKIPKEVGLILTFAIAGVLGLLLPEVLAGGHSMILLLEHNRPTFITLLVLLIVKFLFSALSFSSGAPGGIFFPLLILGAYIGAIFGGVCIDLLSLPADLLPQFIVLGMAGLFSGIVRAPLTGIVLLTEMTGNMDRLLDIAVVSVLAYIVANTLRSKPIYTSLLHNLLQKEK